MHKYFWKCTGNLYFLLKTPAVKLNKLNFLDFFLSRIEQDVLNILR